MTSISPSQLYCEALNIPPSGQLANPQNVCSACARPIEAGQQAGQFRPQKSFNDRIQLATRGNLFVCGWCLSLLAKPSNGKTSGCAHKGGLIPLNSDVEKSNFMRNPPDPPFVVAIPSIDNPQHLFWTASVSYSRDRFSVRFGQNTMLIDRLRVLSAVDASLAYSAADKKRPTALFFVNPKLNDIQDFRFNPKFLADTSKDAGTLRDMLSSMNRGELWLASRMLRATAKSQTEGAY